MKNNIYISLLLIPSLLIACSNSSDYHGNYSFQMGSTIGSHFAVSLNLSNEINPTDNLEKFKFNFDVNILKYYNEDNINDGSSSSSSEMPTSLSSSEITSSSSSGGEIPHIEFEGTYKVGPTEEEKEAGVPSNALMLNVYIADEIEIPKELISLILFSLIDGSQVKLYIPISEDDLLKRVNYISEYPSDLSRYYVLPPQDNPNYYHYLPLPLIKG